MLTYIQIEFKLNKMELKDITLLSSYTAFLFWMLFFIHFLFQKFNKKSVIYSLLFLSLFFITFGEYMLETLPTDKNTIIFWHKMQHLGALLLVMVFPLAVRKFIETDIPKLKLWILHGLSLTLILLLFPTELIIKKKIVMFANFIKQGEEGILYPVLMVMVSYVLISEYIFLIKEYRKNKGRNREILPLLIGIGAAIITGLYDLLGSYIPGILISGLPSLLTFGLIFMGILMGYAFMVKYFETLKRLQKSEKIIRKMLDNSRRETLELLELIASTLEAKDKYTAGHSKRVTRYALMIAEALNLSDEEKELLRKACLLHDIGKIGIPENILNKPARLTEEEFNEIKKHPVIGVKILSHFHLFSSILPYIYHHHERVDGKGYPEGLKGERIPLLSRIIAVADTFDAITSDRPYRKAMSLQQAIKILEEVKGSQLDPLIVEKFIQIIKKN